MKEIGNFPQIQKFIKNYDDDKENSCSNIARYSIDEKTKLAFDFDGLQIGKKTILTDYMSCSYLNSLAGLLISKRFFEFIKSCKFPEYECFNVKIYQNETYIDNEYYWIHYIKKYPELINFNKSIFFINHPEANYKILNIKSNDELYRFQKSINYLIDFKHMVLNKDVLSEFDFFRLGTIDGETYINDNMKKKMIDFGINGLVYIPVEIETY